MYIYVHIYIYIYIYTYIHIYIYMWQGFLGFISLSIRIHHIYTLIKIHFCLITYYMPKYITTNTTTCSIYDIELDCFFVAEVRLSATIRRNIYLQLLLGENKFAQSHAPDHTVKFR